MRQEGRPRAFLEASIEEADGDAAFIAKALGDLARAKGMSQVACEADLSRESLYKALSGDRNTSLDMFLRVVGALGLRLRAEAVQGPEEAGRLCCKPDVGVSQIRTTTVLSSCFCVGQTVL